MHTSDTAILSGAPVGSHGVGVGGGGGGGRVIFLWCKQNRAHVLQRI